MSGDLIVILTALALLALIIVVRWIERRELKQQWDEVDRRAEALEAACSKPPADYDPEDDFHFESSRELWTARRK